MKYLFLLAILTNISFAQESEGQRPSGSRPEMSSELREAFEECIEQTGVERPEPGTRPSEEDRAKVDSCLESKGFEKPAKRSPRGASR